MRRVNTKRPSLAYSVYLGIRVPDYEIDRKLWVNEHYEGSYLFRNSIVLEMVPPSEKETEWKVKYSWQDTGFSLADEKIDAKAIRGGKVEVVIPFYSKSSPEINAKLSTPGIRGKLRFMVSAWNPDAVMDD